MKTKSILGRDNSQYKGPKVGARKSKETSMVSEMGLMRESQRGNGESGLCRSL